MRMTYLLGPLTLALFAVPCSFASDHLTLDAPALSAMADKAQHAGLRDQCYLYAELVRANTELANRELAAGDSTEAAHALHAVETYAAALDTALGKDAKKLKDAEILLRESAFHLKAAMLASSIDDRPAMASALTKIDAVETRVMGTVFAH